MVAMKHAKLVDPVIDEIERILVILQNDDGSWGTSESVDERIYQTAWVVLALQNQNLHQPLSKATKFIFENLTKKIENEFELVHYTHTRKLCGLVILSSLIFEKQLWTDEFQFITNLKKIFDYAQSQNWLNSQLAAYASIFCARIESLSSYSETATRNLNLSSSSNGVDVFKALGSESYLFELVRSNAIQSSLPRLSDNEIAHLLFALSSLKSTGTLNSQVQLVKEETIQMIQRRHLTELDKKVSKEILDLLLLLRAKVAPSEIKRRLSLLGSSIYLKDLNRNASNLELSFELPANRIGEILGRIDLITISIYVASVSQLGEKWVYLVPERDYLRGEKYFLMPTIAIPSARGYSYELALTVLLGAVAVVLLYEVAIVLSTAFATHNLLSLIILVGATYFGVFAGSLAAITRIYRAFFPELCSRILAKIPNRLRTNKILRGWLG